MEEKLAYKMSVDLVKQLIKYQNNVEKFLRYNEYEKIISYSFNLVDAVYEDTDNKINLLHKIKQRIID